jgi:hypothetical protein
MYDDLRAPVACPDAAQVTATCDEELSFIRGYYGFSSPVDEDVADGPREVEASEVVEETDSAVKTRGASEEGCSGGGTQGLLALSWAAILACRLKTRNAR